MKKVQALVLGIALALVATACGSSQETALEFAEETVERNAAIANDDGLPFPAIDCCIYDIAVDRQGDVWAGGDFSTAGKYTGGLAQYQVPTGSTGTLKRLDGVVKKVISDGRGGYFVAGNLKKYGLSEISDLIHLNSDGTLDTTFIAEPLGDVRDIAVGPAVGIFGRPLQGQQLMYAFEAQSVRAYDVTSGSLIGNVPLGSQGQLVIPSDVKLATTSRGLVVAGWFERGNDQESLAVFVPVTGSIAGSVKFLQGSMLETTGMGSVKAITVHRNLAGNDVVNVGGDFSRIEIVPGLLVGDPKNFVRLAWSNAGIGIGQSPQFLGGAVQAIAIGSTGPTMTSYVSGAFTSVINTAGGRTDARSLVSIEDNFVSGAQTITQIPGFTDGQYPDLIVPVTPAAGLTGLVLAGGFSEFFRVSNPGLVLAVKSLGVWVKSNLPRWSKPNHLVLTAASGNAGVVVGGWFEVVGERVNSLLQFNEDGGFGPNTIIQQGPEGTVRSIAVSGNDVIVGGSFSRIRGNIADASGLARYSDGGVLKSVIPVVGSPAWGAPEVSVVEAYGDKVYVGGKFVRVNNVPRNAFATLDATTLSPLANRPWEAIANQDTIVKDIALSPDGSKVIIGGAFGTIGGVARSGVAVLDEQTSSLAAFNPRLANGVTGVGFGMKGDSVLVGTGQGPISFGLDGREIRRFNTASNTFDLAQDVLIMKLSGLAFDYNTGALLPNFNTFGLSTRAVTIDEQGAWIAGSGFKVGTTTVFGPVRISLKGEVVLSPSADAANRLAQAAQRTEQAQQESSSTGTATEPPSMATSQPSPVDNDPPLLPVEAYVDLANTLGVGRVADFNGTVFNYEVAVDGTIRLNESDVSRSPSREFMVTSLKPGNKAVTVTYVAPVTLKNVKVKAYPGGKSLTCSPAKKKTSCTIKGLAASQRYRFYVEGLIGKKKVTSPKSFSVQPFVSVRRGSTTSLSSLVGKLSGKVTYSVSGGCSLVSSKTRVKAPANRTFCKVQAVSKGSRGTTVKSVVVRAG